MTLPAWLSEADDGITLQLQIQPRAGSNKIVGVIGDALKVRVAAAPVDGAANAALIQFLAKELGVKSWNLEIVTGDTGRRKVLRVTGIRATEVLRRLEP